MKNTLHPKLSALYILKAGAFFFFMASLFVSCKKEALSELDELAARMAGGTFSYVQQGFVATNNGTQYSFTTAYVGVPVTLTEASSGADTIDARVDVSLVSAYNELFSETNPEIPEGAFAVSHGGVFPVEQDATQALDSLYVELLDGTQLATNTTYLIPITLEARHGAKLSFSLFFLKMTITAEELYVSFDNAAYGSTENFTSITRGSLYVSQFISRTNGVLNALPTVSFSIKLNTAFPVGDIQMGIEVISATEVITAYEAAYGYGTTYQYYIPFPEETYEVLNDRLTIPAGSLTSSDRVTIQFRNPTLFTQFRYHMLQLNLRTLDDVALSATPINTTENTAYIAFYTY